MKEASLGLLPLVFSLVPGLRLKRIKEVWRECLRPAFLIWALGRCIPFLWTHFPNLPSWMDRVDQG